MITKYKEEHLEDILHIWLEASIIAHDFVLRGYWESKVDDMKNIYIPASETYVYLDEDKSLVGFISLHDNFVAAIFVSPSQQGEGIGKQLINYAKSLRESLELSVYKENNDSVEFYKKQGFIIVEERKDEHTGHQELLMKYSND